jgi:hypothetical protein
LTLDPSAIVAVHPQLYGVSPGHSGVPTPSTMLTSTSSRDDESRVTGPR